MTRFVAVVVAVCALLGTTMGFAPAVPQFGVRSVVEPTTTELAVDIKVDVGDGEPIESAIRRFKREVNKSGHLMELRHKRYFENSQERKKRKIVQARMRKRFERMNNRRMQKMQS